MLRALGGGVRCSAVGPFRRGLGHGAFAEIQRDEQHLAKPSPERQWPFPIRRKRDRRDAGHSCESARKICWLAITQSVGDFGDLQIPAAPAFPWLVRVGRSRTAREMLSLPFAIDDQASVRMNCRPSPPYRASAIHCRLNGLRRTPSHANRSPPEIWPLPPVSKPSGPYERSARSTSSGVYQSSSEGRLI